VSANGREPRSCLGRVFDSKLGCIDRYCVESTHHTSSIFSSWKLGPGYVLSANICAWSQLVFRSIILLLTIYSYLRSLYCFQTPPDFSGVLPGTYSISLNDVDRRCWSEVSKQISVSADVKDIIFKQTGYSIQAWNPFHLAFKVAKKNCEKSQFFR